MKSPFLAAKRARLQEPHITALTEFASGIGARTRGEVPCFDPDSGGIAARALLLYEAPGARSTSENAALRARSGSGIISIDHDDQTAANSWELYREAGLDRRRVLAWNIIPWYIGSTTKIRSANDSDLVAAQPYLERLITLLPDLRVVLCVGTPAKKGWKAFVSTHDVTGIASDDCPHPSPTNLNTRPHYREEILAAFRRTAQLVQEDASPTATG